MYSLRTGKYSDWGNLIMNQVVKIIKSKVDAPLKVGDVVRGYAKYRNTDTVYFITSRNGNINANSYTTTEPTNYWKGSSDFTAKGLAEAFNIIKGDFNIDSRDLTSSAIQLSKENPPFEKSDIVDGRIVSTSSGKIKVS